jgi:hypothetical protein
LVGSVKKSSLLILFNTRLGGDKPCIRSLTIDEKEAMNYRNISLDDIFLCNPYDTRDSRNLKNSYPGFLTEELFIENFYTPPREQDDDENNQEDETYYRIENGSSAITQEKNTLEEYLFNEDTEPMFVRGYSGSGKTTFIQVQLFMLKKKNPNIYPVVLNIQETKHTVYVFKQAWENEKYQKTIYKLYSLLLDYIDIEFNKRDNENEENYKDRLKNIYTNYIERFAELQDSKIEDIFSIIDTFLKGELTYYDRLNDSFCKRIYTAITKLASFDDKDVLFSITNLFKLMNILLFCSSSKEAKYFIVFDNIEYYIGNDMVYDHDIREIVKDIREALKIADFYFSKNHLKYSNYFKTILVIRDTTNNMIRFTDEHHADFLPKSIDISAFYDIDEIVKKKLDYFQNEKIKKEAIDINDNIIVPNKEIIELHKYILKDKQLKFFISHLYNNNKRRMTTYQIKALENDKAKADKYKKLMKEVESIKHNNTIFAYKNGARCIIRRILLDLIQSDKVKNNEQGYFTRIQTVNSEGALGIARRLLIYLYNKAPKDSNNEKYTGFYTLIKDVFESPHDCKIPDNTIENVAKILEVLSDGDLERTYWCQLVVIKFEKPYANAKNIEAEINRQYYAGKDDDGYGIKITDAGRTFVSFSPTFEYFACRYYSKTPALFLITDKTQVIHLLDNVYNETKKCVNHILENDRNYVSCDGYYKYDAQFSCDGAEKYLLFRIYNQKKSKLMEERLHIVQIINSHIGYLGNFRLFLINKGVNDRELMDKVLTTIHNYIKLFKTIKKINSTDEQGNTYYYIGKKDRYNKVIRTYEKQIREALNEPFNREILINGREE